jgi:hypothetical protein
MAAELLLKAIATKEIEVICKAPILRTGKKNQRTD